MKITLDLDKLLQNGSITQEEYARFTGLASRDTASFALNVVLAFGVIAVASGLLILLASTSAMIVLGLGLAVFSGILCTLYPSKWMLLGSILLPLGSLTAAGGILLESKGTAGGFALVSGLFLLGSVVTRSGLLTALSVFALLSAIGGATGYEHAEYFLCIEQPLLTVAIFSGLAALTYLVSLHTPPDYARLAAVYARTAVVIVNLGFWIGSLWGDHGTGFIHSDTFFIVAWALAIVGGGILGAVQNRPWLVNAAATFGAIHLYTQWFEHFYATPLSLIAAGLTTIGIAAALISYNRHSRQGLQCAVG